MLKTICRNITLSMNLQWNKITNNGEFSLCKTTTTTTMKRNILLFAAFTVLFAQAAFAQNPKGNKNCPLDDQKIKAEKIAFITVEIELTVKEAQLFWPVYNEFTEKMDAMFKEEHKIIKELKKDLATLNDKDVETKLDRLLEIRIERAGLENTYHEKFKTVLPVKKVSKLYQSDREFRKHLLQKYKDHPCENDK